MCFIECIYSQIFAYYREVYCKYLKVCVYRCSTIGDCPKLALFLDYDGTLSPICPHPDLAVIPENTKLLLEKLSKCENIYMAIISGRQADDAKKMVRAKTK